MTREPSAIYLYCVVKAAKRPSMTHVPAGLPDAAKAAAHRVATSLWIVAADVPLAIYGPDALEPRLGDMDWVSHAAVAHEAVVERVSRARGTTVIPMKLFTMFSSLDRAIADVAARRDALARTMRRIDSADEWGVRVFRRRVPVPAVSARTKATSGAEFLRARKRSRDAAADASMTAATAAEHAFDRLRRLARDARVRPRDGAGTNPPILDAAFLVASSARVRFKAEARRQAAALAGAGADLALTGPWPAYNFVSGESA
jgi:hypothetical protein